MNSLGPEDGRRLLAAQGWLELENWQEANEELEQITPVMRVHPLVLKLRWEIYAKAKRWDMAVEVGQGLSRMCPEQVEGHVLWAYALHELRRTNEARAALLAVVDRFPAETNVHYNLACYACQLGDLSGARTWLERAIAITDDKEIKLQALEDPDLEPLWREIGKL